MTTISSKQVTTYMDKGQSRLLRKLGPVIVRRNEFSQKLSSLVSLKEQLYHRVVEEVDRVVLIHHFTEEPDMVVRIRNDTKLRHFLSLEGWKGDIGELVKDSKETTWSIGVLVHSGHIYSAVVTSESWNEVVLQSATPVLVEFHGSRCGPCKEVREEVDKLAKEYDGQLKFFVLYTDHDGEIAENYLVGAVPVPVTLPVSLVFKNGERREVVAGTTREEYKDAIERVINEV